MIDKFTFRRHATIGATAAEDDFEFLDSCFINTGDLQTLYDCNNPKRFILGRTGSGKTALIQQLVNQKESVLINPESLSFNFLANSTCLQFFMDCGVKLDLFFKLLWRHVFTIELIKKKYDIKTETAKKSFLERIKDTIKRDKKKERAMNYLENWSNSFWEETEYRIKEITNKLENDLKLQVEGKVHSLCGLASGATKLTEEEKVEVVHKGQKVINSIQMRELTDIMDFLNDDVFDDPLHKYYLCIDKLDENWVDNRFKYLLIRSLIETVRDFLRVRNVKIIVVLRTELLDRVFRNTRDEGFQEEKFRSYYLPLKWSKDQLKTLLDTRVNFLVRQTYTNTPVGYKDILPNSIDGKATVDYMIDRTMLRPRELIEFFNNCIEKAQECPEITKTMLLSAEAEYSKNRLRSLQDEWYSDYPALIDFVFLLRKKQSKFKVGDLDNLETADFCLNYNVQHNLRVDELTLYSRDLIECKTNTITFLQYLFHVLYRTGVVGLKTETFEALIWSQDGPSNVQQNLITETTSVAIHPIFWRVLGING